MGGRAAAVMIGRVPERDRIVEALAEGARGEARAVIVRGEAGIGKTRLVTEALTVAPPPGAHPRVIAVGQCVDLGAIGAPFIPIRRLLRDLHDGVGDEVFRTAAGGPAVLATLARLMPQLADAGVAGPGASGDEYIAEAIEHVIEALSASHHLVLLIEDLHWADSASVALVQNLARTLRGSHLTIIMTVRNGEVGRRNPLREALVEMDRNRSLVTIDVPRLSPEEATQQARAIVGDSLDSEHVATLAARSDGVPFFVEELVQVASEDLPPTLREVTMVRVDRLSEPARGVVRLAAVGGIEVPSSVLDEVWRGGPDELAAAIREAVEADVLVPRGSHYTFRHALIREAVYEDLVPTEAAAIHRRYAELLQSRLDAGEVDLAALASEHWLATHDSGKAFDATAIARTVATQASAIESAAELGERLLTLWQAIPDAEQRLGVSEAALRMAIALEYRTVHRVRACLRVLDDALAAADADDAATRVPLELVYLSVSTQTERTVDDPLHLAEIERLLATYEGPDAAILRARAAATACSYAPEEDRPELAERAFALAEATGDLQTRLAALKRRSRVSLDLGHFERALADLKVAQALTEPLSDDHWWIVVNTVCMYISLGQYDRSIEYGKEYVDAAIAAGLERAAGPTLSNMAEAYIAAGHLDAGLAAARRARALERADSPQFTMNSLQIESVGQIWADTLDDAEATLTSESEQHEIIASHRYWTQLWGVCCLDVAVARAHDVRAVEAVSILTGAEQWLAHLSTQGTILCELDESFVSASAWLAAMSGAGGPVPDDIVDGVRMVVADFPDEVWWLTPKAIARGYLARVDKADEISLWRDAVAKAELGRSMKRYLWLSRYELGTALIAHGERAEGIALLTTVARDASADGIALVARWAREDLAAVASPERASGGPLGQLTPRELEVLALVADGLTNGEIGKQLFISTKTASVHVSAILAKLGAANRAEAASVFAGARV